MSDSTESYHFSNPENVKEKQGMWIGLFGCTEALSPSEQIFSYTCSIGVAPITQLRTCVKIVTFKGGHPM